MSPRPPNQLECRPTSLDQQMSDDDLTQIPTADLHKSIQLDSTFNSHSITSPLCLKQPPPVADSLHIPHIDSLPPHPPPPPPPPLPPPTYHHDLSIPIESFFGRTQAVDTDARIDFSDSAFSDVDEWLNSNSSSDDGYDSSSSSFSPSSSFSSSSRRLKSGVLLGGSSTSSHGLELLVATCHKLFEGSCLEVSFKVPCAILICPFYTIFFLLREVGLCCVDVLEAFCNCLGTCLSALAKAFSACCQAIFDLLYCLFVKPLIFLGRMMGKCLTFFVVRPLAFLCDQLARCLSAICSAIGAVLQWIFQNIITPIAVAIRYVLTQIYNAVTFVVQHIYNCVAYIVRSIWNAIAFVFAHIYKALAYVFRHIFNAISCVFRHIFACFATICKAVSSCVSYVARHISRCFSFVFNAIWSCVSAIFSFFFDYFIHPIGTCVSYVARQFYHAIAFVVKAVYRLVAAIASFIYVSILAPIGHLIRSIFLLIYNYIIEPIFRVIKAVAHSVVSLIEVVASGVKSVLLAIYHLFVSISDALKDIAFILCGIGASREVREKTRLEKTEAKQKAKRAKDASSRLEKRVAGQGPSAGRGECRLSANRTVNVAAVPYNIQVEGAAEQPREEKYPEYRLPASDPHPEHLQYLNANNARLPRGSISKSRPSRSVSAQIHSENGGVHNMRTQAREKGNEGEGHWTDAHLGAPADRTRFSVSSTAHSRDGSVSGHVLCIIDSPHSPDDLGHHPSHSPPSPLRLPSPPAPGEIKGIPPPRIEVEGIRSPSPGAREGEGERQKQEEYRSPRTASQERDFEEAIRMSLRELQELEEQTAGFPRVPGGPASAAVTAPEPDGPLLSVSGEPRAVPIPDTHVQR